MGDTPNNYISLASAASLCPGRPAATTVWRWTRLGIVTQSGKRVYLNHYRVGRRLYTTRTALANFLAALNIGDVEGFDVLDPDGA